MARKERLTLGIIEQLESLKAHCQSMVDENDPECIWAADCEALAAAIEMLGDDEFRKRNGRVKMKLEKEIKRLNKILAPGVEWSDQKLKKAHINLRKWLKELKKYRKLEKQRRLLKLPCVVGDTVYYADNEYYFAVIPVKIDEIGIIDPSTILYRGIFFDGNGCIESEFDYNDDDFGKIVFLTRQEAEEALERMKGEGA